MLPGSCIVSTLILAYRTPPTLAHLLALHTGTLACIAHWHTCLHCTLARLLALHTCAPACTDCCWHILTCIAHWHAHPHQCALLTGWIAYSDCWHTLLQLHLHTSLAVVGISLLAYTNAYMHTYTHLHMHGHTYTLTHSHTYTHKHIWQTCSPLLYSREPYLLITTHSGPIRKPHSPTAPPRATTDLTHHSTHSSSQPCTWLQIFTPVRLRTDAHNFHHITHIGSITLYHNLPLGGQREGQSDNSDRPQ